MLICNCWFHAVFIRQSPGRGRNILEYSKNKIIIMFYVKIACNAFFMYVCLRVWV